MLKHSLFATMSSTYNSSQVTLISTCCRERLLTCICSTEEMQSLSTITQFNLLKRNLPVAELLYNVVCFNLKTDEGFMEYILGTNDIIQWKVKKISKHYVIEKSIYRIDQQEQVGHHIIKLCKTWLSRMRSSIPCTKP